MSGIYIHIPFCKQACHYCNFHFATSLLKKDALVGALQQEIILSATTASRVLHTVYFGGGTPSILPIEDIAAILKTITTIYTIDSDAEITLEANPDDITIEKLAGWKEIGINRLSIGIQSFFEEDLQWMNRTHNAEQAKKALELALQYFDNITIDLIYGTPGLTDAKWKYNVEAAIGYGIPHLSCYALTVEPKTPLEKLIRQHKKDDVNPDMQADQFLLLMDWLDAAVYEHYEISNFAKPGCRSRHNSSYWQGKPYIGIGPSAHSFDGKERRWNVANNQKYIDAIQRGELPFEKEVLSPTQKLNEYIMIALRTCEGLDLSRLQKYEKATILKNAQKYLQQHLLSFNENILVLTRKGKLYADGIAADLFLDELYTGRCSE
ncbi:Heme chaperone HemW [Mycovorax composti]|uniref:Heme chaperone HemW n=1 Tax=Mycovorax composti TaxID=2962693 RepID=A0ABZ2ELU1_9BACT